MNKMDTGMDRFYGLTAMIVGHVLDKMILQPPKPENIINRTQFYKLTCLCLILNQAYALA